MNRREEDGVSLTIIINTTNKEEEDVNQYLNLSPFIIDENAWKKEKGSKLFFFSHFDPPVGKTGKRSVGYQESQLPRAIGSRILAQSP